MVHRLPAQRNCILILWVGIGGLDYSMFPKCSNAAHPPLKGSNLSTKFTSFGMWRSNFHLYQHIISCSYCYNNTAPSKEATVNILAENEVIVLLFIMYRCVDMWMTRKCFFLFFCGAFHIKYMDIMRSHCMLWYWEELFASVTLQTAGCRLWNVSVA